MNSNWYPNILLPILLTLRYWLSQWYTRTIVRKRGKRSYRQKYGKMRPVPWIWNEWVGFCFCFECLLWFRLVVSFYHSIIKWVGHFAFIGGSPPKIWKNAGSFKETSRGEKLGKSSWFPCLIFQLAVKNC